MKLIGGRNRILLYIWIWPVWWFGQYWKIIKWVSVLYIWLVLNKYCEINMVDLGKMITPSDKAWWDNLDQSCFWGTFHSGLIDRERGLTSNNIFFYEVSGFPLVKWGKCLLYLFFIVIKNQWPVLSWATVWCLLGQNECYTEEKILKWKKNKKKVGAFRDSPWTVHPANVPLAFKREPGIKSQPNSKHRLSRIPQQYEWRWYF